MAVKSFLLALALLIAYYFTCNKLDKKNSAKIIYQSQWSLNVVNAQNFLYNQSAVKYNCLLGTSLSHNLVEKLLPTNLYNLALVGQSVSDGLKILEYKQHLPDTIFIEANYLNRAINEEFIKKTAPNAFEVSVKQKFSFLQEKYKLIGLIENYAEDKSSSIIDKYRKAVMRLTHVSRLKIDAPKSKFAELLESQQKIMNKVPSEAVTSKMFENISNQFAQLQKKGVVLVFFEMPVDCSLMQLKLVVLNRDRIRQICPETNYHYLNVGLCNEYVTSDGIHLTPESAVLCTQQFTKAVQGLK